MSISTTVLNTLYEDQPPVAQVTESTVIAQSKRLYRVISEMTFEDAVGVEFQNAALSELEKIIEGKTDLDDDVPTYHCIFRYYNNEF